MEIFLNTILLFRAFGFGILGEQRGVKGFQGFSFGAEEPLGSLLQGSGQHTDTRMIHVSLSCQTAGRGGAAARM